MSVAATLAERLISDVRRVVLECADDYVAEALAQNPTSLLRLLVARDPEFLAIKRENERLRSSLALRSDHRIGLSVSELYEPGPSEAGWRCAEGKTEHDDYGYSDGEPLDDELTDDELVDDEFTRRMQEVIDLRGDELEVAEILPPFETESPLLYYIEKTEPRKRGRIYDMTADGDVGDCIGCFTAHGEPTFLDP